MMHKTWSSIEEVPYCFSRSYVKFQGHTALKIVEFDPNWAFPDSNSSLNSPMAMKCCTKLETAKERCPIVFQGHPSNFYRPVAAFKSLRFALLTMFPSSYHHEIFRSNDQWQKWRPCKRSRSEVKGQGHRGQHPTWPFPDHNSSLNSDIMMEWCTELDVA